MLVGYMRASSDSDRQTTDLQRDALMAAGVDSRHLFEDHASGAKDDRPGLSKALEFVRPGDVLVVWKLDRLGRSLSHLLRIVNALKENQVAFRSLTEGMDTTTPSGELLFHVFGALAQYERALTSVLCKLTNRAPKTTAVSSIIVLSASQLFNDGPTRF
jgi:DNA invertase Pin-like site-specific DNA recombinase